MPANLLKALLVGVFLAGVTAPSALADARDPSPPPNTNIVGGHNATEAYSFVVSLQYSSGGHTCGASLIRPNWLVTAKHCVEDTSPSSLRARIGSNNRNTGGTVARISRIVMHQRTDTAVLQLTESVRHTLIPIASSVPIGSPIRMLGWGQTSANGGSLPVTLQELDSTVVPDRQCWTGAEELCVGNVDGWRAPCFGDSGGPAVLKVDGAWQLAGATSGGTTSVCGRGPEIYEDIAWHKGWIEGIVGQRAAPFVPDSAGR